jgi:uncharacterized membrane protein YdbT with pleckstrin-like domain
MSGGFAMDDLFENAMETNRDRVISGFYTHFMIFIAVITGLAIINLIEGDFWVQWVILGWGAGIAFHAYRVFVLRVREDHVKHEQFRAREERRKAAAAEAAPSAAAEEDVDPVATAIGDDDPTRRI